MLALEAVGRLISLHEEQATAASDRVVVEEGQLEGGPSAIPILLHDGAQYELTESAVKAHDSWLLDQLKR